MASVDIDLGDADLAVLLDRLERQAAESGRLEGRVQTLERALKTERDTRRRAVDMLKRERKAAAAIAERADRAEQQLQISWARLAEVERLLSSKQRPLWRKLLRRPPAA
jgi:ABC-type transporter Mla subunit MlaD